MQLKEELMWRVLVPLDGSAMAESVLADAEHLAGPGGTIILVMDAAASAGAFTTFDLSTEGAAGYLDRVARTVRAHGFEAETHVFDVGDPASVIERAAAEFQADIMAVVTHARTPEDRWRRGSVAWTALMRSVVPVLLRRGQAARIPSPSGQGILVPLDGSELAEGALPLAQALAVRWQAPLYLVQVLDTGASESDRNESEAHLTKMAEGLTGNASIQLFSGPVDAGIAAAAGALGVTHIVMTSHGKTGLTRAIVGSVADEVIHRVSCPVIILPPLLTLGEVAHDPLLFEQEKTHVCINATSA
jgi:nucleotide-binding universal stress UspA family protein